ncbi:MAG: hypothetical protein M3P44_15375 [Actinomycetota bacterium]|nr:hypothetical protein [Actinomycetota bacterium]
MQDFDDHDLEQLGARLRREATRPTAQELDQLKLRTTRRAQRSAVGQKGTFMRSRLATLLTVSLLTVGAGGTFAVAHSGDNGNDGSAAKSQYKPGKGCGDKNHTHARHDECPSKFLP